MKASSLAVLAACLVGCILYSGAEARVRRAHHKVHATHRAPRVYNNSNYPTHIDSGRGPKSKSFAPRTH